MTSKKIKMKKLILLFALVIGMLNSYATVTDNRPITENIKKSFGKEFNSINEVSWTWLEDQDVYRATFLFEGKQLNAYFTTEGTFVGTSRYIMKSEMPVIISQNMQKEYKNLAIRTVIEYASSDNTFYYITAEGKNSAMMIKATPAGQLSFFKKIRKED